MSFLILYRLDYEDGPQVPVEGSHLYAALSVNPGDAASTLTATRAEHPDAFLAEPLTGSVATKGALPGELARAIEAWNAMPKTVTVPRLRGNLTRLVAPYRRWKTQAGQRDYLLEQLVADVESLPCTWGWIRFPWLFGQKNGELNSEKLHSGQWKSWAAQGAMTQRDYAMMAARVTEWRHTFGPLYVGDSKSFDASFKREIGLPYAKWEEIQRQFNGATE